MAASISFQQTFASFKHRNFRIWFIGQLVSLVGTWMQNTAQGYLIFTLTQSPAFLGYVSFFSGMPAWLFTLYGGVIADRMPRRILLIITQSTMMVLAFILAGLIYFKLVQPWHILVLSFLLGVANAFDAPARQAFTVEMVSREDLTNAIAMNATMFNGALVVGPAVAGFTYAVAGPVWCFIINGLSFIAVIIALLLMKLPPFKPLLVKSSSLTQLKEGLAYAFSHKTIRIIIINIGLVSFFGMGIITLMPAWAVTILHGDVTTNGLLLSARGIGAMIGALMIAVLSVYKIKGRLWVFGSFIMPVLMLIFAVVRWLPFSLLSMVLFGLGFMLVGNISNALVQSLVSDELRGRVMGIYTLLFFGLNPIGSLLIGVMATKFNEPITVIFCAVILLVVSTLIRLFNPQLQHLE